MKKLRMIGLMCATCAMSIQTVNAFDYGLHASWWDPEDGEGSIAPGIRLIADSAPFEIRASYYNDIDLSGGRSLDDLVVESGLLFGNEGDSEGLFDIAFGGGVSYHFLDVNMGNVDDELGWYATVHLAVPVSKNIAIFGEAMYRGGLDSDDLNADLGGSVFNLGVIFR